MCTNLYLDNILLVNEACTLAVQVEVVAAGDDKTAEAKVEQELLQVRKKKGGLKVSDCCVSSTDLAALVPQNYKLQILDQFQ